MKSKEVDDIANVSDNSEIQTLIDHMVRTVYENDGVGLAANQIGQSKRIIIYDKDKVLINPYDIKMSGDFRSIEECLSIMDMYIKKPIPVIVDRFEKIIVRGFDRDGKDVRLSETYSTAACLQHEIDHLNGILTIHRCSQLFYDRFVRFVV